MKVCDHWTEKYAAIDFKGGVLEFWEDRGEDMLEVWYENGCLIDVGYNQRLDTFFVIIIKDDDWAVPVRTMAVRREQDLVSAIRTAVDIAAGL